jgi:ribosomal protein L24
MFKIGDTVLVTGGYGRGRSGVVDSVTRSGALWVYVHDLGMALLDPSNLVRMP